MILSQALSQAVLKNPAAPALFDLGKALSFLDMRNKISQLSYLYQAEIGHGKRVAIMSQNNPAAALSFFAFSNIGCQVIFFDPNEPLEDVSLAIKELEITHIAISADQSSRVGELSRKYSQSPAVIEIEKKKGGEYDTSYSPPPDHPLKETDKALILRHEEFGQPTKYIFFTHKQIYSAATVVRKFYHFKANERVFTTLTWAHPFSLLHGFLTPLFAGATCAINPQSATNEEFIEYIAQNRITRFVDSPKYFYFLLSICSTAKYMLPGVKSVTIGCGNLPKAIRKTFHLLNVPVMETYGRIEAIWTLAMEDLEKARTSATPVMENLPGFKYKVLNQEGDEITGEGMREGPLAVASESLMTAFHHPDRAAAEKASKLTIRGTWFYTGDIAQLEGEKDLVSIKPLGPQGELIYSGTRHLQPVKIDEIARGINDLTDAAAFVRINDQGDSAFAVAAVKQSKLLSETHVLQALKDKLSEQEMPKTVHFVEDIPRDRFGNVNRAALQRQLSAR
jgi:malonyl-CoA/methylmalonyl-CoA synthetase